MGRITLIVDYIGIRDNMPVALKTYAVKAALPWCDVERNSVFLRTLVEGLFADMIQPFLYPNCDRRTYRLWQRAESVFNHEGSKRKATVEKGQKGRSRHILKTVKGCGRVYICQPSGELGEEESALAQCFMAIAGFVRKMSGTSEVDAETMNRHVAKMVEEALKYNEVESVLEDGEQEDIFSPEYFEKLSDVKMAQAECWLELQADHGIRRTTNGCKAVRRCWRDDPAVSRASEALPRGSRRSESRSEEIQNAGAGLASERMMPTARLPQSRAHL
jgi:hypothetical protein